MEETTTYPRLETRKVSDLVPNARNPRKIGEAGLRRLRLSLGEFGNLSPITVNVRTGTIVGGHQRAKVLAEMGAESTECWCVDLSPQEEMRAMLILNTQNGTWEAPDVGAILVELSSGGVDLDTLGFSELELQKFQKAAEVVKRSEPSRIISGTYDALMLLGKDFVPPAEEEAGEAFGGGSVKFSREQWLVVRAAFDIVCREQKDATVASMLAGFAKEKLETGS